MRLMTRFRFLPLAFALACLGLGASCSSNTSKQISSFANKICECSDAACATAVQTEYLQWWKDNQRARGSEGDRKDIEKAMQRYAECHLRLVGPDEQRPAVVAPKVDLRRPAPGAAPAPAPAGAAEDTAAAVELETTPAPSESTTQPIPVAP